MMSLPMQLSHYAGGPDAITPRRAAQTGRRHDKPEGLWVSVDGDDDWPSWCRSEEWGLGRLAHHHRVTLADGANLLVLSSADDLDAFTAVFGRTPEHLTDLFEARDYAIDWPAVAERWQGVVIAPYQWSRRFDLSWYYGWDCASGCIWDPAAIASVELLAPAAA